MLGSDALKMLAMVYCAETGLSLAALGNRALGNHKFFKRLMAGSGYNSPTGDKLVLWFAQNWPADVPWPRSIPRPANTRPSSDSREQATQLKNCKKGGPCFGHPVYHGKARD